MEKFDISAGQNEQGGASLIDDSAKSFERVQLVVFLEGS